MQHIDSSLLRLCLYLVVWGGLGNDLWAQKPVEFVEFGWIKDHQEEIEIVQALNKRAVQTVDGVKIDFDLHVVEIDSNIHAADIGPYRVYATDATLDFSSEQYRYSYIIFHLKKEDGSFVSWTVPINDAYLYARTIKFHSYVFSSGQVIYIIMSGHVYAHNVREGSDHIYAIKGQDITYVGKIRRSNEEHWGPEAPSFSSQLTDFSEWEDGIRFTQVVTENLEDPYFRADEEETEVPTRTYEVRYRLTPSTLQEIER